MNQGVRYSKFEVGTDVWLEVLTTTPEKMEICNLRLRVLNYFGSCAMIYL